MNTIVPISAVIITLNEEDNIGSCLKALLKVVDEVVVIDSFSEDKTVEICKKLGAKVVQKEWEGYSKTKNFGNSICKNDWILSIDADEVLSDELIENLNALQIEEKKVYTLNRIANFEGKWVRYSGWHPDWKPRLFNRKFVKWTGDFVHETLFIPNNFEIIHLDGLLYHYSYKNAADHLDRIEKYAQLAAKELFTKQKKTTFFKLWFSPIARFIKTFFIKKGFLDGKLGWQIASRDTYLVHRKYQLLKELNKNENTPSD